VGTATRSFYVSSQQDIVLDEGRVEEVVVETLAPLLCPFQANTQIRGVGQYRIALLVLFPGVGIDVLRRRREGMVTSVVE
jgi:hypothetical protein